MATKETATKKPAEKKHAAKAAPKAAPKVKADAPAKDAAPKAKKAPVVKKVPTGATVRIVQVGSPIGRQGRQEATLRGLGLGKRHRERVLQDTPEVRGMIEKVKHLVKVI